MVSSYISIIAARTWENKTEVYHFEYRSGQQFLEADILISRRPSHVPIKSADEGDPSDGLDDDSRRRAKIETLLERNAMMFELALDNVILD
jgi:hypothetical protein